MGKITVQNNKKETISTFWRVARKLTHSMATTSNNANVGFFLFFASSYQRINTGNHSFEVSLNTIRMKWRIYIIMICNMYVCIWVSCKPFQFLHNFDNYSEIPFITLRANEQPKAAFTKVFIKNIDSKLHMIRKGCKGNPKSVLLKYLHK